MKGLPATGNLISIPKTLIILEILKIFRVVCQETGAEGHIYISQYRRYYSFKSSLSQENVCFHKV